MKKRQVNTIVCILSVLNLMMHLVYIKRVWSKMYAVIYFSKSSRQIPIIRLGFIAHQKDTDNIKQQIHLKVKIVMKQPCESWYECQPLIPFMNANGTLVLPSV